MRPVRGDEMAALADLTEAAYARAGAVVRESYRAELRDVAGHAAAAEVLVAVDVDGVVRGGLTYIADRGNPLAEHDAPDAASFRFLAVAPAAQRRGVATALIDACAARGAAAGKARLVLHTVAGNDGARRLYERLGFVRAPWLDRRPDPAVDLIGYERPIPS